MKKVRIDATGVDEEIRKRTRTRHIPEGEYLAKITGVTLETSQKDESSKYYRWAYLITEGKHKGTTVYGNASLKRDALWNLRNIIFAATGKNIAGRIVNFDADTIVGKVVGISVSDNEYTRDGTTRITSQVDTAFPKKEVNRADEDEEEDVEDEEDEDEEEEEEEEERPARKSSRKRRTRDDEDEEDEELEDVDLDEI